MTRSSVGVGLALVAALVAPGSVCAQQQFEPGDIPASEWVAKFPKSLMELNHSQYAAEGLFSPCPQEDPARAELFRAIATADLNIEVVEVMALVWRRGALACGYAPFFDWITDLFVERAEAGLPMSVGLSMAFEHPVSDRNRRRLLTIVRSGAYPEEVRAEAGAHAVTAADIQTQRALFLGLLTDGTLPDDWGWGFSVDLAKEFGDGFANDLADVLGPGVRPSNSHLTAISVVADLVRGGMLTREGPGVRRLQKRLDQEIEWGYGDERLRAYAQTLRIR